MTAQCIVSVYCEESVEVEHRKGDPRADEDASSSGGKRAKAEPAAAEISEEDTGISVCLRLEDDCWTDDISGGLSGACPQRGAAHHRGVSFGAIEVREYPQVLGDMCPSSGPPIAIGWKHRRTYTVDIDEFELRREPGRTEEELQITPVTRERILRNVGGHSSEEIRVATSEAKKVRRRRKRTVAQLRLAPLEEALQSTERKIKRALRVR